MRYIQSLTDSEIQALEDGYKNDRRHYFRRHCHCILLSNEGYSPSSLAKLFDVRKHTVLDWFNVYESEGISGLVIKKGRGRKSILDSSIAEKVVELADGNTCKAEALIEQKVFNNPQNLKLVASELSVDLGTLVTVSMLKRYLKKKDIAGNGFANELQEVPQPKS